MSSLVNDILQYKVEVWKVLLSAGTIYISLSFLGRTTRQTSTKTITEKNVENPSSSIDSSDIKVDTTEKKDEVINKDEEDEEEDLFDGVHGPYTIKDTENFNFPCKLVLCVNMDLNMTKGKIAAQCGHATLGAYKIASKYCKATLTNWEYTGQAKIALKVDKEDTLLALQQHAIAMGLVTYIVQDAGRTQIAAGSKTVLAIGPAPASIVDKVTSHLKLL